MINTTENSHLFCVPHGVMGTGENSGTEDNAKILIMPRSGSDFVFLCRLKPNKGKV